MCGIYSFARALPFPRSTSYIYLKFIRKINNFHEFVTVYVHSRACLLRRHNLFTLCRITERRWINEEKCEWERVPNGENILISFFVFFRRGKDKKKKKAEEKRKGKEGKKRETKNINNNSRCKRFGKRNILIFFFFFLFTEIRDPLQYVSYSRW